MRDDKEDSLEAIVLFVLRARIRASRRTLRDLDRALGLSHGTVANVMRGKTALRLGHLDLIAPAIDVDPRGILEDALHLSSPPTSRVQALTRDELAALVADSVRGEVARLADCTCGTMIGKVKES